MPTPKRSAKKKQSFLSKLIPTTRKAKIITFVAAFAIIGGGIMVYRSFAATVPDYASGAFNWINDGSRKSTSRISTNGNICVEATGTFLTNAQPILLENTDYAVRLFTLVNGKWIQTREVTFQFRYARSTDKICWPGLSTANVHRVQFDPLKGALLRPDRAYARVEYKVRGYNPAKGEASVATKNPQPTPSTNPGPESTKAPAN